MVQKPHTAGINWPEYELGWEYELTKARKPKGVSFSATLGWNDRWSYIHDIPVKKDVLDRISTFRAWQDANPGRPLPKISVWEHWKGSFRIMFGIGRGFRS